MPDLASRIATGLRTARFGRPVRVYDRVTSTNDLARELAGSGAGEGTAVLALQQTAGRGRLGRPWVSPPGGMYLSVILRPPLASTQWPLLAIAMAVGAATGAQHVSGRPITLKWPNDLLWGGRKVGGVLVDGSESVAVAGMGINAGSAGTVSQLEAASLDVDLVSLVVAVLFETEQAIDLLYADPAAVLAQWRMRSDTLGRQVRVLGTEPVDGIAEDIEPDGALILRTPSGVRRIVAGDLVLR